MIDRIIDRIVDNCIGSSILLVNIDSKSLYINIIRALNRLISLLTKDLLVA